MSPVSRSNRTTEADPKKSCLGQALLQPIGAPPWDQPSGPVLFAFEHGNCVRTAEAWRRLKEHRLSCLPAAVQAWIDSPRGPENSETDGVEGSALHRGSLDRRFRACGIDRRAIEEPVRASMTDTPTCELRRSS